MLIKQIAQQMMNFFINPKQKIVLKYQDKYERIDNILDENPQILNLFHKQIEKKYAPCGRDSKFSSEQLFRYLLVKQIEDLSYRKTVIKITDSIILRNFVRIGGGDGPSYAKVEEIDKAISPEVWREINDQLFNYSKNNDFISSEKLRVDSTATETNIHFPTDIYLLWDCYRVLVNLIRHFNVIFPLLNCGHRFHDDAIKEKFIFVSTHSKHKNKSTKRRVKKDMVKVIKKVEKLCEITKKHIETEKETGVETAQIFTEMKYFLKISQQVAQQSRRIHINKEKVKASEKIFSVFEEHTELLIRGKAGKAIEFGHMITLGQTGEKFISFYDVQEKSLHDTLYVDTVIENHKEQFGKYPEKFTADKNYWENSETTAKYEEYINVFSVAKKGNKNKDEQQREKKEEFKSMQKFRAGIEGSISVLKRVFGLKRCFNRGFESFASCVGKAVLCHNLVLLATQ